MAAYRKRLGLANHDGRRATPRDYAPRTHMGRPPGWAPGTLCTRPVSAKAVPIIVADPKLVTCKRCRQWLGLTRTAD